MFVLSCGQVARTSSQIATSMKETISQLQNLSRERIVLFFSLQAGSAFFIFMAFFVGLPALVLAPSKFAICFTVVRFITYVYILVLRKNQVSSLGLSVCNLWMLTPLFKFISPGLNLEYDCIRSNSRMERVTRAHGKIKNKQTSPPLSPFVFRFKN